MIEFYLKTQAFADNLYYKFNGNVYKKIIFYDICAQ